MFKYIASIWNSPSLRKKILFTIALIIVYRLFSQVPVPTADPLALRAIFDQNQALGFFSMLMGGSMDQFSVVLMGLSPYINASIIIQLLTVIVPKFEALKKEGERGQKTLNRYTRWLTVPLALAQSYGMLMLLSQLNPTGLPLVDMNYIVPIMLTVTAATLFLMWLGELITEKGIGNGISLLIFASIAAGIPGILGQTFSLASVDQTRLLYFAIMIAVTIGLTVFVVWFTEGQRQIPLTYAGHGAKANNEKSAIPIKVNQSGMIPIIFAMSLITFPGIIAQLFAGSSNGTLIMIGNTVLRYFDPNNPSFWYVFVYFLLVIGFSYFYVSITFNPQQIAENVQKRGGFVPGIRPGRETAEYLQKTSHNLNLWGSLFIALVAVFPYIFQTIIDPSAPANAMGAGSVSLLINGASLIIIVGVVLELIRTVNVELVMHDYERFV